MFLPNHTTASHGTSIQNLFIIFAEQHSTQKMKSFQNHLFAIELTFRELAKGKYWLYLLPSLCIGLIYWIVTSLFSGLFSFTDKADSIPLLGSYFETGINATKSFFGMLGSFFFEFIILTCLSPIYCLLSEKVDNTTTGAKFNGGIARIIMDLFRSLFIVLISMIFYFTVVGFWWFFAWLTGFHILDKIIYFAVAAFFLGFSFYDYSLERYQVGVWKAWMFSFENMFTMLLTGAIFHLSFQIPNFGVILAPFLVTIISTLVYLKMNNKIPQNTAHE